MYVVSEPWYFVNHRLEHAKALLAAGFDVEVATRQGDRFEEAREAGCVMHEFDMTRSSAPTLLAKEALKLRRLVRRTKPDVVHAVALKPVALSLGLFSLRRRPSLVLSVNGLGISAVDGSRSLSIIRRVLQFAGRRRAVELLFQTRADQRAVTRTTTGSTVIPGVGVNLDDFAATPKPPAEPLRIVYLGRAVRSKGLTDLAKALSDPRLQAAGLQVDAYCSIDDQSPGTLSPEEISVIEASPLMTLHSPTRDPSAVLATAHGAILPSRAGEGVSRFVLEALATATPVLLSSESGSGEVIQHGREGLTFEGKNPTSLADALLDFKELSDDERQLMGEAGRRLAVERYSSSVILPQIVELHRRLAAEKSA